MKMSNRNTKYFCQYQFRKVHLSSEVFTKYNLENTNNVHENHVHLLLIIFTDILQLNYCENV